MQGEEVGPLEGEQGWLVHRVILHPSWSRVQELAIGLPLHDLYFQVSKGHTPRGCFL